jgi:hypothetical protein
MDRGSTRRFGSPRAASTRPWDPAPRFKGSTGYDLTDSPLLMNPEALAQSPLQNLPGAALGQLGW